MPALDEVAVAALEEAGKAWRQVDPVEDLPADRQDWFASPPGLLAHAAPAGPAAAAKENGKMTMTRQVLKVGGAAGSRWLPQHR
jgi:hypothetical protein